MVCSSVPQLMFTVLRWNKEHGLHSGWWGKNNSPWGDLTKMAMLDDIQKFQAPKDYNFVKPADTGAKNINLYLCGDSYTEDVPGYVFANVDSFFYGSNLKGLTYDLNPNKKNILILEVTERFVISLFSNHTIFDVLKSKHDPSQVKPVWAGDGKKTYGQIMNQNLEYLLFDYNAINKVRFAKADITYNMFDRASGNVAISEDGRHLFLRQTITGTGKFSSYAAVADTTITNVVNALNDIYDHYRKEGFTEVYFSPIPSPASLLQPDGYNQLLPRIKNNPALKMPLLDVYDIFKNTPSPETLYRTGDTHWNDKGMQIWLGVVNERLREVSQK
jgi:hypothetical protein